jgi:hypothetical protein
MYSNIQLLMQENLSIDSAYMKVQISRNLINDR